MALSRPNINNEVFNRYWIEKIILDFGDKYHIRVQRDKTTAILTGVFAVAGGLVGGYAGGRVGAVVGAGVGGVTGFGLASLREMWPLIRDKLEELIYIVFNFLRRIDPVDIVRAYDILMACKNSKKELVITILNFLVEKLGRQVVCSLMAA